MVYVGARIGPAHIGVTSAIGSTTNTTALFS